MQHKKGEGACNSINLEISQLRKEGTQAGFIYRLHDSLRNVNSKEYEPDILAIGPYHHGKDRYKMMEEYKLIYLQALLNRNNESTADRYISAIAEVEQEARNCYAEPINLSEDEFIKMLVLDGCFIIEFLKKLEIESYGSSTDPIFGMQWIQVRLMRDLILFENQMPFFVLCKLVDLIIEGPNKYARLIYLIVAFCNYLFPDLEYRNPKTYNSHDVKHLLELVYNSWVPDSLDGQVHHVELNRETRFINSAAELKDANVKFKKRKSCQSLFEVKFQNGTMLMPPLIIDKTTECFFRNLIAYEQYFPKVGHSYVTNYVILFDLLINSSKDVEILSECGIIESWLGDNEEIPNIINKLMESVAVPQDRAYAKTFEDINTYYKKRRNRWMAVLNRDYFSSPWAYISLSAAFVLLLLTIVQTVCSILQVV